MTWPTSDAIQHTRRFGLVPMSIHDTRRADALYAEANALGLRWWGEHGAIGALPDGRLAIIWETGGLAEQSS